MSDWEERSTDKKSLLKMESDGSIFYGKLKKSEKISLPKDKSVIN